MATYYFPIRGERYVPDIGHALGELIDCIIHNTKLVVYSDFEEAKQAGYDLLFDDDTFTIFSIEEIGNGSPRIYAFRRHNLVERGNAYVWLPKEIINYIQIQI